MGFRKDFRLQIRRLVDCCGLGVSWCKVCRVTPLGPSFQGWKSVQIRFTHALCVLGFACSFRHELIGVVTRATLNPKHESPRGAVNFGFGGMGLALSAV